MQDYMVFVHCSTYNHSKYIEDAMQGFAMQRTNFPFICVIVDDASIDGEPEIIMKYLDDNFERLEINISTPKETDEYLRVYARHKVNKNCYFCVLLLKYNHYSIRKSKLDSIDELLKPIKYRAICEGDDYWTDSMKLQKQVDFLEEHEEYVLCAHNSITLEHDTGRMACFNKWFENHVFTFEDVIKKDWFLPTQSLLYRTEVLNRNKIDKRFYNGDYFLQLCLTKDGGLIYYSNECMAVYRIGTGISRTVTVHENNLRLIELLEFMRASSSTEYDSAFEERVNRLRSQNERLEKIEQSKLNSRKFWYRIRYRFLYVFVKLLSFKNPRVMFYKDYWN